MFSFLIGFVVIAVIAILWWFGAGPIGPLFNRAVDYCVPRINPNLITLASFPLTLAAYYNFVNHQFFDGAMFWLLSWACDFIDGKVARRYGFVSKFGELLDPLADCFRCYFIFRAFVEIGVGNQHMVEVMLFRDIIASSFLRQVAGQYNMRMPARPSGKLKAVLQFFGGMLIIPLAWWGEVGAIYFASNIMLVVTITTLMSGLEYMWFAYKAGLYSGWHGDAPSSANK